MSEPQKRVKLDPTVPEPPRPDFARLYDQMLQASKSTEDHQLAPLLRAYRSKKQPILQVIAAQSDVYKTNPEKKKKPIQLYLDTVNHLYKKRDLDILVNPVTPSFVFEKWAPREVAVFEEAVLKFGKQFEFIAQLIGSKDAKEVYEFYLEWKSTSHYKSYRSFVSASSRTNMEDYV